MMIVGVGTGDHEQRPVPGVLNELSEFKSLTPTLPIIEHVTTALKSSNWAHMPPPGRGEPDEQL
jgi:hypothetical protein